MPSVPMVMTTKLGGTPWYLPPEVTLLYNKDAQEREYDPRKSDVYSLSLVLYFMWTRSHPFGDLNQWDVVKRMVHDRARPEVPRSCGPALQDLLKAMWAHEPRDRPSIRRAQASFVDIVAEQQRASLRR
jgi:serine/threonine protein kinase